MENPDANPDWSPGQGDSGERGDVEPGSNDDKHPNQPGPPKRGRDDPDDSGEPKRRKSNTGLSESEAEWVNQTIGIHATNL